jgi:hypothetical protein
LEEQLYELLEKDQVEQAKIVNEKKILLETLHTPYPTWPFRFRSKIFSTILTVSSSLLLGVMTAAVPLTCNVADHNPQSVTPACESNRFSLALTLRDNYTKV